MVVFMERNSKFKSKKYTFLLYPDDPKHYELFEKITSCYDHIGILHDKDLKDDGTLKKPHWHLVLVLRNERWNTALASELDVDLRFFQRVRNQDAMLPYLIHFGQESKHQYDVSELFGTSSQINNFHKILNKAKEGFKTEGEKIMELIEFINNADKYISIKSFATFCASNGYWSEFRRSGAIFLKMIEERNKENAQK